MKRSELFFAFLQIPIDIIMIVLAFIFAYYARADIGSIGFYNTGLNEYLKYALILTPVWVALFALNGLYSIKNTTGFFHESYKIIITSSTAILFFVMIIFFTKTLFFSRIILVFIWGISIVLLMLGRFSLRVIRRFLLRYNIGIRSVLLIGNNQTSKQISKTLSTISTGYRVAGVLGSAEDTDLKVIGSLDDLRTIFKKYPIDEVILTDPRVSKSKIIEIMEICSDQKVSFKYVLDTFALISSSFHPGLIGSIPVMELKSIPLDGWGRIIKRIADIILSAFLLILLSPILIIIGLLVKLTTKGPVLYLHQRVGRDEQTFDFYKFRSMYIDKCDYKGGVYWSTQEDEKTRITPIGKFLRNSNLDELPQLWNIFKGDMSFVGPRPELPKLVTKFEQEIPEYFRRHKVKSGLTGWAQINGLKGDTSISERVRYDIYYIENWSFWFDFKIIIKTIGLIFYELFNGKSEYRTRP